MTHDALPLFHDVAALQAALANIEAPGTNDAFWSKGIGALGLGDAMVRAAGWRS